MEVTFLVTLASYESLKVGVGPVVDGKPPKKPIFLDIYKEVDRAVQFFKDYPTGTKLFVTIKVMGE